jgi:8-oxo-dGTP pyrophosphatase MutT (NUDIX family)
MKHSNPNEETSVPFRPSAGVLLVLKSAVVLAKRIELFRGKKVPFGGYWSPFAGGLEEGENPMTAALRELKEETGIKKSIHELKFASNIAKKGGTFSLYIIEIDDIPTIKLDEEHTEYGIFKISELDNFPGKIDPNIVKSLKDYIKRRDEGIRLSEK